MRFRSIYFKGSDQSFYLPSDTLSPEKEILFFFDCVAHRLNAFPYTIRGIVVDLIGMLYYDHCGPFPRSLSEN
jgi:hypothetical protein